MQANRWLRRELALLAVIATAALPNAAILAQDPGAEGSDKPEPGKVRIAVVQQETVPGAVEANRAKALRFAREAVGNRADIVLFHEALVVGYVPDIRDLAEPADGPTTRECCAGPTP